MWTVTESPLKKGFYITDETGTAIAYFDRGAEAIQACVAVNSDEAKVAALRAVALWSPEYKSWTSEMPALIKMCRDALAKSGIDEGDME